MARAVVLGFFFFCSFLFSLADGGKAKPLFFEMGEEYRKVAQEQEVFLFRGKDSLPEHQMLLLSDSVGNPLLFYADIYTPVCIDNICKPVQIEIYWDLLGEYVGFALQKNQPLTKFDHEEFEPDDYEKFHALMLDDHSVLDRSKMEDLFDKNAKVEPDKEQVVYNGVEVDAVSEPTKKVIRESTVEGALYSCYTLWHLVNGESSRKIKNYFSEIYNDRFSTYLLDSPYESYQRFALKKLTPEAYLDFRPQILHILESASPLTRSYVLKKLPDEDWADEKLSEFLYENFSNWDMNTQTLLLKHLEFADERAALWLSTQLSSMKKRQLEMYLTFLPKRPAELDERIRQALEEKVQSDYNYTYLIKAYLGS
ncbi:MAG: hypothetical protein AAFR87_09555 [Bacteroidota bacterium]